MHLDEQAKSLPIVLSVFYSYIRQCVVQHVEVPENEAGFLRKTTPSGVPHHMTQSLSKFLGVDVVLVQNDCFKTSGVHKRGEELSRNQYSTKLILGFPAIPPIGFNDSAVELTLDP